MQKSEIAWRTAARMAALAQEADDPDEREYYARLHDAWVTLANRCDLLDVPDVADKQNSVGIGAPPWRRGRR
jgi:hypothetical protein